ncbi:class I SAM-dependent methyltransferase [Nocardia sp. NPDC127579]|uniref:class I SAM-dependent methyltransferase n=1 Tax=Nocardia sp. NPDC127579 TaxID=3345402 RepID=UPI003632AF99
MTSDIAATRSAYDGIAEVYSDFARDQLDWNPLPRRMLTAFAESVGGGGEVADIGCGPGWITAELAGLGLDVRGIDLSDRMIALARAEFPHLRFDQGTMESLPFDDDTLDGVVAWYSMIHLPPDRIPGVLAEFTRVLRPGGHALLATFAIDGSEVVEPFDHKVIRAYRWPLRRLAELSRAGGLEVLARLIREPGSGERFEQGYLLCRKPR